MITGILMHLPHNQIQQYLSSYNSFKAKVMEVAEEAWQRDERSEPRAELKEKIRIESFAESGVEQPPLFVCDEKKDCECCKGLINMCQGEICEQLGVCYCTLIDEEEEIVEDLGLRLLNDNDGGIVQRLRGDTKP